MNAALGGTLLSLVESIGDSALKKYAKNGTNWLLGIGISIYILLALILSQLFKSFGLAIVNSYWDATSNILTMFIGFFIFHENYTIKQWIGMMIVSVGIILINGF